MAEEEEAPSPHKVVEGDEVQQPAQSVTAEGFTEGSVEAQVGLQDELDTSSMLALTWQTMQDQGARFAKDCNECMDTFSPWLGSKLELVQHRATLAIPVDLTSTRATLVDGFIWATACASGMGLGQIMGHSPTAGTILEHMLTKPMAFILTQFILPLWYYAQLQTKVPEHGKFQVVMLSTVMGLLCGYSLLHKPMDNAAMPPGFIQCILMGYAVAKFPYPNPDRAVFLGAVVGSVVCISLMLAMLTNQMSNAFVVSLLLSVAVSVINLQLTIATAKDNDASEGLAVLLFGSYSAQTFDYFDIYFIGHSSRQHQEL